MRTLLSELVALPAIGIPLVGLLALGCGGATSSAASDDASQKVVPFSNVAPQVLSENAFVWNRYPGVAIFDYDRDGDLDFYVTQRRPTRSCR